MLFVIALLMIVAVGFAVLYPLWRTRPIAKAADNNSVEELLSQKEATVSALKELDFDYALGNLTEEDHSELEQKYKNKAVSILKQIDEHTTTAQRPRASDEGLEAEILQLRRARKAQQQKPAGETAASATPRPQPAPQSQQQSKTSCPKCRSQIAATARYCPYCGSSLEPAVCSKCSTPYTPGQRFCGQCGAPLAPEEKGK